MLLSIKATVSSVNSLPGFPFTVGLSFFNRYMNNRANNITFCVTSVAKRIVVTQFLKLIDGNASGTSGIVSTGIDLNSSI